jgi:hypothetical protein
MEIFPKAYRILVWVISIALIFLILLTGFIAVQVAALDKEIEQLRSTM